MLFRSLGAPGFDPRAEAAVEGAAPLAGDAHGEVRVIAYSPEEVTLRVQTAQAAFLASSEVHYPGWRAYIDGVEAPLVLTNAAFRGLAVPAGTHTVTMRFRPKVLGYGAALSLAGVVLAAAAAAIGDNRRKRAPWISSNN